MNGFTSNLFLVMPVHGLFVLRPDRPGIFRSDRNAIGVGEGLQNLGICSAASALICAGRDLYRARPAVTRTESRVWSPFMTSKGY